MIRGYLCAFATVAVALTLPDGVVDMSKFDDGKMPHDLDFIKELAAEKAQDSPSAAPAVDMSALLASLHKNVHDVHAAVHDTIDDTLSHPGLQPAAQSLNIGADDSAAGEGKSDSAAEAGGAADDGKLSKDDAEAVQGMQKLMGAVKMIVMLQPMLEPLKQKLTLALEHLPEGEAKKAKGILGHIEALNIYSKVTAGLMAGVMEAKDGTDEDKKRAMATLIVGVKQIQSNVAGHLAEMKAETKALTVHPDESPASAEPAEHGGLPVNKMTALLLKLGKKIQEEIKDPAAKHDPKVLLDIKLFMAVKESLTKTEALMMAAKVALDKATTPEEKEAVKLAVKKGLGKVADTLKSKMEDLKKNALLLAAAAAKAQESGSSAEGAASEDVKEGDAKAAEKGSKKKEPEEDAEEDAGDEESTDAGSADAGSAEEGSAEEGSADDKEAKAPADEGEAQSESSTGDDEEIEKIFGDAAGKATGGGAEKHSVPLLDDAFHLRTH